MGEKGGGGELAGAAENEGVPGTLAEREPCGLLVPEVRKKKKEAT